MLVRIKDVMFALEHVQYVKQDNESCIVWFFDGTGLTITNCTMDEFQKELAPQIVDKSIKSVGAINA